MSRPLVIDVLMVTHERLHYTRKALPRLLASCDEAMRVWVWHNGDDAPTLDYVRSLRSHPRFFRFHHSRTNERLWVPTNWLWAESDGELLSRIDDDCLVPDGWGDTFRQAHLASDQLGVLGCWSLMEEDVEDNLVSHKRRSFGNTAIVQNSWVGGAGHVIKRACVDRVGPLPAGESFPRYCIEVALNGWINGFPYPFVYLDHLDDPRHPDTRREAPAPAIVWRAVSRVGLGGRDPLDSLRVRQKVIAREVLTAGTDPRWYVGWRGRVSRVLKPVKRAALAARLRRVESRPDEQELPT